MANNSDTTFQLMVEASPNALIIVNKTGEIILANKQTEHLFNYEREELIGRSVESLLPKRYRINHKDLRNMFFTQLVGRPMGAGRDLFAVKKDGVEFPIEIGLTPIFINGSDAVLTTITDITQRKKLEEKEKIHLKKIEEKNKELEDFAFIVSHDLRAPLQSISSFTQLLLEENKSKIEANWIEGLNSIQNSVNRMNELISGILDFARIGKSAELQEVDLNSIIRNVMDDLRFSIRESNCKINLYKLPTIKAYKTEIRLLFQNLISNAIKFRSHDVPLEISINAKEAKSSWKFSVSDNGVGLKPEDLEEIFILFKRTANAKDIDGTGIGLAHCRKIVALHNGEIYADSTLGKGTTFHFNISKFIEED